MAALNWNSSNVPSLSGKVAIVTGSTSGIGRETATVLALKGAEVILAVRDTQKGEKVKTAILSNFQSAKVSVLKLDLSSLDSIADFANTFQRQYNELHILVNNAGVMVPPYGKTADGFELQFGTNHLGHFALTGRLMNTILATKGARIVNVSSMAHKYGKLNFEDLQWEKRNYSAWKAYGDSKISNLYFTYEMHRRLISQQADVLVLAAHPGYTDTDLQRHSGFFNWLNAILAQPINMGALPTLYAATAPEAVGGGYYGPASWGGWRGYPVRTQSNELSHDTAIAQKLWRVSEQLTGISFLSKGKA